MVESDGEILTVLDDPHQACLLGMLDGLGAGEVLEQVEVERLAQGEQLQSVQHWVGQSVEAAVEQRGQLLGDPHPSAQLPDTVVVTQRARIQRTVDEMVQVERVPAGRLPDQVRGQPLEVTAEDGFHQRDALFLRERQQVEPGEVTVLPQRHDGVGDRLAAADGRDDVRRPVEDQLVQQGRGELVEQVCVVDSDHGRPVGDKRGPRGRDERHRVAGGRVADQVRERPERHAARRLRARDPAHTLQRARHLTRERRLPHTGVAGEHDAARATPTGDRRPDRVELGLPPHQRPPAHDQSLIRQVEPRAEVTPRPPLRCGRSRMIHRRIRRGQLSQHSQMQSGPPP